MMQCIFRFKLFALKFSYEGGNNMEVSTKLKERFCKDCSIPIRVFQEPYFTDRLNLFNRFYGTLSKWEVFLKGLERYQCEQDYFEEYNRVKDAMISDIKGTEAYQRFNNEDMNKYRTLSGGLPSKDIFKANNDGRIFISIDMRKANFSSLRHYDPAIFGGAVTWEEYVGRYTDNRHVINSKYIRQVVLGNCNPKRQITYEKFLMDRVLVILTEWYTLMDRVVFFSNDEIVLDVSDMNEADQSALKARIEHRGKSSKVPLKVELFALHKITGTDGYYKEILCADGSTKIEFKCLDNFIFPFVLRKFLGEEVTESDKVFFHEGLLAKFIEIPEIGIPTRKGQTNS